MTSIWVTIAIAKVQDNPKLPYKWLMTNHYVVPILIAISVLFFLIAIYETNLFRRCVWFLARLVPMPDDATSPLILPAPADKPFIAPTQRLTIRIEKGFCGERKKDPQTTLILLSVVVNGPSTTVKDWTLQLKHPNGEWWTMYEKIIGELAFRPEGQDAREDPLVATQISELVPDRGWVLFKLPFPPEYRERHIFGALFSLTAIEDNGAKSVYEKPPETWLHKIAVIED